MSAVLRRFFALSLGVVLVLSAATADAKKTRRTNRKTLLIFPVAGETGTDRSLLDMLEKTLTTTANDSADIMVAKELDKRQRGPTIAAARRCNAEPSCLRPIGKKLKVEEVMVGTARKEGSGLAVVLTVVQVARGETPRRVSFSFVTQAELDAALGANEQAIFGKEAAPEAVANLELVPLADPNDLPLEAPPPAPPAASAPDEPNVAPMELPLEPPPAESITATPSAEAVPLAAPSAATTVRRDSARPWNWWMGWKSYTGGTVAALALLGGAFTVQQWMAISSDAERDDRKASSLDQPATQRINEENERKYDRLVTLRIVCGVAFAAGLGLVGWDLLDDEVAASVTALPGGAAGSLTVRF